MIRNYAPKLYKTYEDDYLTRKNKGSLSKRKSLIERPTGPSVVDANDPKKLMQDYFAYVREKREQLNDTT